MSVDAAAVLLGAALCGLGGTLVPALVSRVPEPAEPDDDKEAYAVIGGRPGLWWHGALASAFAGGLVAAAVGLDWPLLFLLPLVPVSVALALIDWRTRLLPTIVVWPTFAVVVTLAAVCAVLASDGSAFGRAVLGAAVTFGSFYVLWWVHPAGMGYGDVRLSAVLGFALGYLGWAELLLGIYTAFLVFSVPGMVLAGIRRDSTLLRRAYPFGPFLLGGALFGIVTGPAVWGYLAAG